jgi:hypothetical protein
VLGENPLDDFRIALSPLSTGRNKAHSPSACAYGVPRQILDAEPRKRRREAAFSVCQGRKHDLVEDTGILHIPVVVIDVAGHAQNVRDRNPLFLARKFVTAARATDAVKDTFMHKGLEHWLEMPRREIVARRELARGDRPLARIERDINDCNDGQESLAGEERHVAGNRIGKMILNRNDPPPQA